MRESASPECDTDTADSLYRRLFEHARDVVLVVDEAGKIVEANLAAEDVYGFSRDELVGMPLVNLRSDASLPLMSNQLSAAARSGGVQFETEHRRADGSTFPVEVSSRGVDYGGERLLLSMVRDISQRREQEAEREQLVRELAEANARLDALVRIVSGALRTLDLEALLRQTLRLLTEETGADSGLLLEADGDGLLGKIEVSATEYGGAGMRLGPGEGFGGRVAAAGTPLYVADVQASDFAIDIHEQSGFRSMFGVPMYLAGELYGVLELAWRRERNVEPAEMHLVQAAAERVMLAVANAKLFSRAKRAEALSAALNDVNSLVNSSFDPSTTMATALEVGATALEADVAVLAVNEDGAWRAQYAYGVDLPADQWAYEHWTASERRQRVSTPVPGSDMHQWLDQRLGVKETVTVRLDVRGRQVGLLLFGRRTHERPFGRMSCEYAERFASAIALALSNAAEFENEHRIAERLQEALLTMPSSVRGLEFSHLYRSATVSTRVGGDFYDVFELAYGRVGVVIGDVSGKGLEAAVLTSVIKDTIRALAHDIPSPAEVMTRANVALGRAAKLPEFASVFFAIIDTRTSSMTYCCAGHPPAAVLTADGGVQLLDCTSAVIGAIEDLEYVECTMRLAPGEIVFLYTDGVTEARREDGVFFGEERLIRELWTTASGEIGEVPIRVFDSVMEFTGGRLTDDIALLAFQLA
ncbi:MAG: SpoIIE family protein phosphatase [Coriobacteriia bacterium]|nr:SpoIIE family protein phosphatase [Coriobacteriia bacterium]